MEQVCQTLAGHAARLKIVLTLFLCAAGVLVPIPASAAFRDPLDTPAGMVGRPGERPMHALAKAGSHLVAVGPRGVIVVSADNGKSWTQSPSPVQSDLVAVQFPSANKGWAVGHDGVVLHSADAGKTWKKQLDGRTAKALFIAYYKKTGADAESASYASALAAIEQNYKAGPSLPFLDVWFDDDQHGFVVGAFGMVIATADGGQTWAPWLDRIDNPDLLSLNAIRGGDGGVYVVAERGGIFRLDRAQRRFVHVATGYAGSFFGVAVSDKAVLAYGLRGAVYRSADQGQRWEAIPVASQATISAGAVLAGSGEFVLANNSGEVLIGNSAGTAFVVKKTGSAARYTSLVALPDGAVLMSALEGIRRQALK